MKKMMCCINNKINYLFEQEGNYLVLFGGSWCHNTRAASEYINDYANEYGIDTILPLELN